MRFPDFNLASVEKELTGNKVIVGFATCGISAGAQEVYNALEKAKLGLPLIKAGCLGMCFNEPVVCVYLDGQKWIYGKVSKENVGRLIDCIKSKRKCEELFVAEKLEDLDFYKKQKRIVMENCGVLDPLNLEHYLFKKGYSGLKNALKLDRMKLIDEMTRSGLRGRGGAGFSTGKKWGFIANKEGKKYIICNGDEGDPGAFMNRTVLESDPFRVIEGMTIGAYATGADEGIIYTRAEYPLAVKTLNKAIQIAYDNGLLGKELFGIRGFNFDLYVQEGAGAFVCGEETALIKSAEGHRGHPSPKPPFPADNGIYGKPTVVNNVETWAQVASIMKIGVDDFLKVGSQKTKGTKTVCLVGQFKRNGVIEVPFGTSLKEIVFDIGGGGAEGIKVKALLSGGPSGGCIPIDKFNTGLDYETLVELGSIMGSGGLIAVTDKTCMVDIARYYLKFTQEESCGKCTPCREGTRRLLELLIKITRGVGTEEDLKKIEELANFISENSLCGLGQFAPNPVLSTLKNFRKEYLMHIIDKKCPAGVCENLITYFITKDCKKCGNCARHCPTHAISGSPKEIYKIDQSKCIKCGACYDNCVFKTIIKK